MIKFEKQARNSSVNFGANRTSMANFSRKHNSNSRLSPDISSILGGVS